MLPDKTGERRENAGVRPLVKQFCCGIPKHSNRNLCLLAYRGRMREPFLLVQLT